MNTKDVLIVLFIFLVCSKMVKADTRFYSDSQGNQIGSSYQMGGNTYYQDPKGNPVGSTTTMGNYTSYNRPDGSVIGSSVSILQFEPHVPNNTIEVRGNKTPKKIKDVFHDEGGSVDWIEFVDGSTFPDKEFLDHGKGGGVYDGISTLFFKDSVATDKALMLAVLKAPNNWTMSTANFSDQIP